MGPLPKLVFDMLLRYLPACVIVSLFSAFCMSVKLVNSAQKSDIKAAAIEMLAVIDRCGSNLK